MSWTSLALGPDGNSFWFPPQASQNASLVDNVYYFIYWVSVISFVLIMVAMAFFIRKYARKKPNEIPRDQASHNTVLEIGWSLPVAIVSVVLFYFGAIGYIDAKTPPDGAYEIRVRAFKYGWEFSYANGATSKDLHMPADTPVRLVMSSDDLLHSLYIPAFRLKQDVVPGRYTDVHVNASKPGEYIIYCTEYCGTGHSNMMSKALVYPAEMFVEKLDQLGDPGAGKTPEEYGEWLYENKACNSCHNLSDKKLIGPGFKGLWGKKRDFADGTSTTADENYIRNSILNPKGQIVNGYPNAMPSYQGQLGDKEIDAIIAFLKTVK